MIEKIVKWTKRGFLLALVIGFLVLSVFALIDLLSNETMYSEDIT